VLRIQKHVADEMFIVDHMSTGRLDIHSLLYISLVFAADLMPYGTHQLALFTL
jgi:hypothetical protein